jgi:transposase
MAREPLVRALNDHEGRQLRRLIRAQRAARVLRRARVIDRPARGQTAHQIANLLGRSGSGVRKIINRFHREGLSSLADKPGVGRRRKATDR